MKAYYFLLGFAIFFKKERSILYTVKALKYKTGWGLKETKYFWDKYNRPILKLLKAL